MIHIRNAKISDAEAINKLNLQEMGYDYPIENTKEIITKILNKETDRIFVASVEDKVIGYIHINDYHLLYAPTMKNIMGIAVAKDFRRKGVGSALIAYAERWAKETGATAIRLVSGAERCDAHEFYKRLGFSNEKTQIKFIKDLNE